MVVLNSRRITCIMGDNDALTYTLQFKKWALLDIEYIQISKHHKCIRKLYALTGDGIWNMEREFVPCKPYHLLESKYRRSFRYCSKNIHHLPYYPETMSSTCVGSMSIIRDFVTEHGVEVILYKGGTVEQDICREMEIDSQNIEALCGLKKVYSHDPGTEVTLYWDQLNKYKNSLK